MKRRTEALLALLFWAVGLALALGGASCSHDSDTARFARAHAELPG